MHQNFTNKIFPRGFKKKIPKISFFWPSNYSLNPSLLIPLILKEHPECLAPNFPNPDATLRSNKPY